MSRRPMSLDRTLGYVWAEPSPTAPIHGDAFWQREPTDPAEAIADHIVEAQWRVDHLRDQIESLGAEPKGRTRRRLAEQLAERYIDPLRLLEAAQQLSEEEHRYYVTVTVQAHLQDLLLVPDGDGLWQGFSTPWPKLTERLIKLGLALKTEESSLLLPSAARQRLPDMGLPFPATRPPAAIVPPPDPRELLIQIQQLLALLQVETFRLRARVRWRAPDYPYAEQIVCWPISPSDAQRLTGDLNSQKPIELLPPEPYPEDKALQRWAQTLGITEADAEWLYALLRAGELILDGSPLAVASERGHAWMALTPGRQLKLLFEMWRSVDRYAVWWPGWRQGQIQVSRRYQGFWGLVSVDSAVHRVTVDLRRLLIELLSALPEDTWLATEALLRWLRGLFPESSAQHQLMGLSITSTRGGWPEFLEALLLHTVRGPLRAFGLVDVGPSLETIEAIRLHGLRDLHWERADEATLSATETLQQAAPRFHASDAILEVTPPVPPGFMTLLLQWARPAGFSRNLIRYQLDVERLHQSFEGGEDPTSLSEAWKASLGREPLPEIRAWWDTWWARYGHVRLYPTQAMLQTRDAITMEELQVALPDLQTAIIGDLTPDAALLRDEAVDRILEGMARQGYMPKEIL